MITFLILILALSLDTFMAALSYETDKIKIPFLSNFVISFICSFVLIISLTLGSLLDNFISHDILKWISFLILFFIGAFKIFDSQIKKCIRNQKFKSKKMNFSVCNLKFILQIYSDYPEADQDKSKTLSVIEAVSLALALSIDGLSAGLAFQTDYSMILIIFVTCLLVNIVFILLAKLIGYFTRNLDLSFISGLIFIVLAFLRL